MKIGRPTSTSEHNPQQFHGLRAGGKVWHEPGVRGEFGGVGFQCPGRILGTTGGVASVFNFHPVEFHVASYRSLFTNVASTHVKGTKVHKIFESVRVVCEARTI